MNLRQMDAMEPPCPYGNIQDLDYPDDDDYAAELFRDRKSKEGWTECSACKVWLHSDDVAEGSSCDCEDEEDER